MAICCSVENERGTIAVATANEIKDEKPESNVQEELKEIVESSMPQISLATPAVPPTTEITEIASPRKVESTAPSTTQDAGKEQASVEDTEVADTKPVFEIMVTRGTPDETLGVQFDTLDKVTLYVNKLYNTGRFAKYNQSVAPHEQILVGDFILSVNDISNNVGLMLDQIKQTAAWKFKISRPFSKIVTLPLSIGEKLGINCAYDSLQIQTTLVVREVSGAVSAHNVKCPKEEQVLPRDRIIAVDGVSGTAAAIMAKLQKMENNPIILKIVTPHQ